MPTMQELIDKLPCLTSYQHKCLGCPFNPHPGQEWVYGCGKGQNDMIAAVRDVLRKYQEVMNRGKGTDRG